MLDIAVPTRDAPLSHALVGIWPSYLAWVISFLVIGAISINHHATFRHIVRADGPLLPLNVLHLMFIALLPFPTAVLAEAFHRAGRRREHPTLLRRLRHSRRLTRANGRLRDEPARGRRRERDPAPPPGRSSELT